MTDPRDYTLGEAEAAREAYARGRAEALAEVDALTRTAWEGGDPWVDGYLAALEVVRAGLNLPPPPEAEP